MSIDVDYKVYIDWNDDGDFADTNEDVSKYFRSIKIDRGRSDVNDDYSPGKCTVKFSDHGGLLSPFDTSSALSGSIRPGHAMKIEAEIGMTTVPLFYGFIRSIDEDRESTELYPLTIQAFDALEYFRRGSLTLDLAESSRVDTMLASVLDEVSVFGAAWPAGLRDLETAFFTIDIFTRYRKAPLSIMREIALQELGGHLYAAKDGKVTFKNRWYRTGLASSGTIGLGQDLEARAFNLSLSLDDYVDQVEFTRAGLDIDDATTVLYTLTPTGRAVAPGASSALNTIHGEFSVAGKDIVTPVATTDWVFNSEPDGSGIDRTGIVTVDSFQSYGGGFSITFNNADASTVYLTQLQIRGKQIRRSNDERKIIVTASNPLISDQVLQETYDWNDDADLIRAYANLKAAVLNTVRPRPPVIITPSDNTQLTLALNTELGAKYRLLDTSGLNPTGVDAQFHVEKIKLDLKPKTLPQITWHLWHEDQAQGNWFRVSPDAGDAYSVIATDAATEYDRIGI